MQTAPLGTWRQLAFGAVGALFALATSPALAQSAVEKCAAEAASQWEPGYETIGRDTFLINAGTAIEACTAALEATSRDPAVLGWLARSYYAAGEKDVAVPLFEEASSGGSALAQALYGDMLIVGDTVAQDMVRGTQLLQAAAEAGFAPAQNSLGLSYDFGEGVEQDFVQAVRWYRARRGAGTATGGSQSGADVSGRGWGLAAIMLPPPHVGAGASAR